MTNYRRRLRIDDLKRDIAKKSQLARFMLNITENGSAQMLRATIKTCVLEGAISSYQVTVSTIVQL